MSAVNGFSNNYFSNGQILSPAVSGQSSRDTQTKASASNPPPPPGNNEILASSLYFKVEKIPPVEVTSSVGSLRFLDAINYLASLSYPTQTTLSQNLNKKSLSVGVQTDALINIRKSLNTLSAKVAELLGRDSLNTKSAKSSNPKSVAAEAGSNSPVTSVSVIPLQVSAGNILVSNEQPSVPPALGLTGSFVINGYSVPVVTADTIYTLKEKINYGEDLNRNRILDGSEDIDGTGKPGIIFIHAGEFTPGVYIVKDQNGKGYLSPSEDANDNGSLDGGTKDSKVVATIENNRLKLTSLAGGAKTIDLLDPNNILLSLGFFELNGKGLPVQKESQYTISNTALSLPSDLIAAPQQSVITVDGQPFASVTNVFKGVLEDLTLTVNKASDSSVTISILQDPANALDKIKSFFNNFNEVISKINNSLITTKTFETDTDIQRLRNQLTQPQEEIPAITKRNENIDEYLANHENQQLIGFKINSGQNVLQGVAVDNQVQSIKDQMSIPFKSAPALLQKRLSSLGIRSAEDGTFVLDEAGLKRALTINRDEVVSLFTDPRSGILPQLKSQLDSVLEKDIGRIDLKATKLEGLSNIPSVLAEKYKKYIETFTLQEKTQNLLAVG